MTTTVAKQQIIVAALQCGFTDADYGHVYSESVFDNEIGIEEYACGERILKLLALLGVEVTE